MGIADKLKGLAKKAKDAGVEHKEQIEKVIDKAEKVADQRTKGKYHDQIGKAGSKADSYLEGLEPTEPPKETPPQ